MIVHVFPQEKFTISFIKFINSNFKIKDHIFLIYGKNDAYKQVSVEGITNIKYISDKKNIKTFINYINKGERIIFHSLFIFRWMMIYLFINKKVLSKCNWVIWGDDLYSSRNTKINNKEKIIEFIKKDVVKRFGYISSLVDDDYNLAKKWYKVSGQNKRAIYINPITIEYLNSIINNRTIDNKDINIQIGNSADQSNNHLEIIDILTNYKFKNIKIYVPLSYGDKEYALKVKKYGEEKLGDKFSVILDLMQPDKYGEFLGKIDIAIFNNNRQQALGNIFALAYLGTKIYMRDDTTMWKQLVEKEGYKFNNISDIMKFSFEEFIGYDKDGIKANKNISKNRFDEKYITKVWKEIFDN